jgi:hypothetical protein
MIDNRPGPNSISRLRGAFRVPLVVCYGVEQGCGGEWGFVDRALLRLFINSSRLRTRERENAPSSRV